MDRSVTALATTPQAPRRRYRVADSTTPSRIKPRHGFAAFGERRPVITETCKKNSACAGIADELSRIVHDHAARLGGSISAEHGLGQMKREEITHYKSAIEIDLMKRIKAALDPDGIMNPGKVI